MAAKKMSDAEQSFLQAVMQKASLPDIYDARDITIVVFRSLRDLMTTEAATQIANSFEDEKIAKLWKDDNPVAATLAKLRPPLKIDTSTFLRRIGQEAGLPRDVKAEAVVIAVFSTVRELLPAEAVQQISSFLPDGLKVMWEQI